MLAAKMATIDAVLNSNILCKSKLFSHRNLTSINELHIIKEIASCNLKKDEMKCRYLSDINELR